ncbi:MAG: AhpC/TSA family protein [Prevotellaceae bacterium]|jgi:peroxiredoxin|nr:AhpC/TSA family protein [Prevotellaceae bacterium]
MKNSFLFYLLLVLLSGCAKRGETGLHLSGEIKGLGNDTIYLYGIDHWYDRIDTLPVVDHKFNATLSPDTFATALLLFSNGATYPLFLNKTGTLTIKGSADNLMALQVKGTPPNEEMTAFNSELGGLTQPSAQMMEEKADSFIARHPTSRASVYLLDRYFVQTENPDIERIQLIADRLTGELKDTPYMERLLQQLQDEEKVTDGKVAPTFIIKKEDGTTITRIDFKEQYLLIHFWASWDTLSRADNDRYRRLYKQEQKKKKKDRYLAMLGVSLDTDKKAWQEAIKADTLKWEQASDLGGWNSEIAKQFMIRTLPANILLRPNGRIEARNLDEAAIEQQLKEIEAQEKAKQEREKEQQRQRQRARPAIRR